MLLGFVLLFAYGFAVWLVFFKFRWLKFTIPWGFFSTFFVLHLGIIFLIGLRFVAPTSTDARVIQRTIQLTPRLSEPTLVTAVLVEPNVPVKRGTPLFQFDRRPYEIQAELDQARYYLDNTLMVAPEDGYIMNLQVRPGMVAGDIRMGAIASFICDADRYLLANYFQENLKYVKPGQTVEVALDLYPGQIWPGKVAAIWQGSGAGQMLPSGTLPSFNYLPAEVPQGQF